MGDIRAYNAQNTDNIFNIEQLNSYNDEYSNLYDHDKTDHIAKDLYREIYDAIPEKYKLLKLLFLKPAEYCNNSNFSYEERTFGRVALKAASDVGASSVNATQDIVLTAGGLDNCTINDYIVYPDSVTQGTITNITIATNTITVAPMTNQSLPAVTAGTLFPSFPLIADGMYTFYHYDRMTTIQRSNYVQLGQRSERWTRMEQQAYMNSGVTNYFDLQRKEKVRLCYADAYATFINGSKGEASVALTAGGTTRKTKKMNGIYPTMVQAGSQHATATTATLVPTFKEIAQNTNYKTESQFRIITGTAKTLNRLSDSWKAPKERYTVGDTTTALDLDIYNYGGLKFSTLESELFRDKSMFPNDFENKLFVIDPDTITPIVMKGYQMFEMGQTKLDKRNSGREDYTDWWIQFCLSLKMPNPYSSFWIDIIE
jgi:hypothetical protein